MKSHTYAVSLTVSGDLLRLVTAKSMKKLTVSLSSCARTTNAKRSFTIKSDYWSIFGYTLVKGNTDVAFRVVLGDLLNLPID